MLCVSGRELFCWTTEHVFGTAPGPRPSWGASLGRTGVGRSVYGASPRVCRLSVFRASVTAAPCLLFGVAVVEGYTYHRGQVRSPRELGTGWPLQDIASLLRFRYANHHFSAPPPRVTPALLQSYRTTTAQDTPLSRPSFCMLYTIQDR